MNERIVSDVELKNSIEQLSDEQLNEVLGLIVKLLLEERQGSHAINK